MTKNQADFDRSIYPTGVFLFKAEAGKAMYYKFNMGVISKDQPIKN